MSILNRQRASGSGGQPTGGYVISQSCRFNGNTDNAELTKTDYSTSGTGASRTLTFSWWSKLCLLNSHVQGVFSGVVGSASYISHKIDGVLGCYIDPGNVNTTARYWDPGAWYHWVVAIDTTQSTAADRVNIYVNGVKITDLSATSYPALNKVTGYITTTEMVIGDNQWVANYNFNGYLAEIVVIDGLQLTPTSFGEFDNNGVWVPIDPSGLTFGTN